MPFKPKPTIKVGRGDWEVEIPRPPKKATHAILTLANEFTEKGQPKKAMVKLEDFGTLRGVAGSFHYVKVCKTKAQKVLEEYPEKHLWNGREVEASLPLHSIPQRKRDK
tara:strand:- start:4 stop:330 length:327 start_codon:yes stop_codon:yes gene_type:complete